MIKTRNPSAGVTNGYNMSGKLHIDKGITRFVLN